MRSATTTMVNTNAFNPDRTGIWIYVVVTTPSGNVFNFAQGMMHGAYWGTSTTLAKYQYTLKSVSTVSSGVDPFTREFSDSDCEIEILDVATNDGVRGMLSSYRLLGSTAEVRWSLTHTNVGSTSNTTSIPYFKGQVMDVIPHEGYFTLHCRTKMTLAMQRDTGKQYFNKHPLALISTLLTDAGVPSAYIDSTSLTPSTWTDISHFVVSTSVFTEGKELKDTVQTGYISVTGINTGQRSIRQGRYNPTGHIKQLAQMCLGTLFADEEGIIKFVLYDAAASADRALTDDDIFDVKIDTLYGEMVNRITFQMASDTEHYQGHFVMEDTASQTNFTPPSGSAFIQERTINFDLLKSRVALSSWVTSTSAVDITIKDGDLMSYCGMRGCDDPASQPADAKISTTRPLVLRIDQEIIKETDALTISSTGAKSYPVVIGPTGLVDSTAGTGYYCNATLESSGMTRGYLSTTARVHPDNTGNNYADTEAWVQHQAEQPIQDLTIPERWGRLQLARFSNGCPVMSFKTNLRHVDLEIGDVVTIEHQLYAFYQDTSSTTATTWEIINKEVDIMGGEISWKVARITRTGATSVTSGWGFSGSLSRSATADAMAAARSLRNGNPVVQGLDLATASGLTFTMASGSVTLGSITYNLPVKTTYTVAASKDTYVCVDLMNGNVVLFPTTLGGDVTGEENMAMIGKVVSNGSATTSVVYLANSQPVTASQADASTRTSGNLVPNGNLDRWSRGNLQPPDQWFFSTDYPTLTTDDVGQLTRANWDTSIITRDTGDSRVGTYRIHSDGDATLVSKQLIPVEVDQLYQGQVYIFYIDSDDYSTSGNSYTQMAYSLYDANKVFLETVYSEYYNEAAYDALVCPPRTYQFTTDNADARYVRVCFTIGNTGGGLNAYYDNIQLKKVVPQAAVFRSSGTDQTGIATGTYTTVQFNAYTGLGYTDAGNALLAWDTSTYTYTVPVTGFYRITVHASIVALANAKTVSLWLYSGAGTQLRQIGKAYNASGGADDTHVGGTANYYFTKGDTFVIKIWHNNGSNRDMDGDPIRTACNIQFVQPEAD